ncbi:uncharacterized protein DSM5745_00271 [Aspergillus mulundensis]|uniref:Uncharacterized protein n=1 Tax=Aspergillus mulundensis TaxID=1810919 RepID=A0A3D8T349_9EURO|nr:hypothetical protein DSM5745_00271 [Aspergillus mulundensis]RDW92949.1 hypothetical protein DSM5745_00271 [Aspergillus mulundensis]
MPVLADLPDLPPELLDEIFALAFDTAPSIGKTVQKGDIDVQGLSRLLLVNRKWYQAFVPRLYSRWTFNGARHSYSGLWKFIRTVVTNPDLAARVQVLNIGNWGGSPAYYLARHHELLDQDRSLHLSPDDEEVAKMAIRRAGLTDELGSQILRAVFASDNDYRDRRPLVALLLCSLPRVSTVYAHVPETDPFLGGVLKVALDQQQAASSAESALLLGLRELHVLSEVPNSIEDGLKPQDDDISEPSLQLHDIWPALYLRHLNTLRLYNLDPDGLGRLLQETIPVQGQGNECHIQHLHIATKRTSACRAEDLTALLTLPTALKSLSLSWDMDKTKTKKIKGKKRNVWQISNNEVWNAIQKHKGSLEYLDMLHAFPAGPRQHRPEDHFGLLTAFTKLSYLSIMTEMLIGGYHENTTAPFRLKDTLPASIESLVIATDSASNTIPDLIPQIAEVVSQFPHLKSFQTSDYSAASGYLPPGTIPSKYQPIKEACFGRGIRFSFQGLCSPTIKLEQCPYPLGARCISRWKQTYKLRIDGIARYKSLHSRAKRKAAGRRETPSPPPAPARRRWRNKTHVIPFQDHGGHASFMVFQSEENTLLPPLMNITIYFTHPEGPLPQPADLEADLRAMHAQITADGLDEFHYRLDVYFLPAADNDACIAHYQAEKASRGTSRDMYNEAEIRLDTDFPPPSTPRLPGMVQTYRPVRGANFTGLMFVYPDRTWRGGAQQMCRIRYGPGFELGQPFDARWFGFVPGSAESLGHMIWEYSRAGDTNWQEGIRIYQDVTERGWTTW